MTQIISSYSTTPSPPQLSQQTPSGKSPSPVNQNTQMIANTPPPNAGRTEILLSANESEMVQKASGIMSKLHQNREIVVERNLTWKGERYKLKLHLPLEEPLSKLGNTKTETLKKQADELVDLMVEDLQEQLNKQDKIQPGDNCNILFEEDGKYTVAHEDLDIESLEKDKIGDKKAFIAENDKSAAIAKAACGKNAEAIFRTLHSEALQPQRLKKQKELAQKGIYAPPINLENNEAKCCWANCAFQELVNDELVANELADPNKYKDGENSPLFKAIQNYRKNQQTGNKFALGEFFKDNQLNLKQTDDLITAWNYFENELKTDEKSRLNTLFKKPIQILLEDQTELDLGKKIQQTLTLDEKAPDLFTVVVQNRKQIKEISANTTSILTEKEKIDFFNAIGLDKIKSSEDLKNIAPPQEQENEDSDNQPKIDFINKILEFQKYRKAALNLVNDENLREKLRKKIVQEIKFNDAKFKKIPDGKLNINETNYDIASFSVYTGSHYISYIKKGVNFYQINDLENKDPSVITKEDFLENARSAYFYVLHKEGLSPDSKLNTDSSEAKKAPNHLIPINPDKPSETIEGTSIQIQEERGLIDAVPKDFVIVNPSTEDLMSVHPQLKFVLDEKQLKKQKKTAIAANERWYKYGSGNPSYKPRTRAGWFSGSPDMLLTSGEGGTFIHIPLPESASRNIKQTTTDILEFAHKNNLTKLAIPLLYNDQTKNTVNLMKKAISEFGKKHKNDKWLQGVVKIVYPPEEAKPAEKPEPTNQQIEDAALNSRKFQNTPNPSPEKDDSREDFHENI